MATRAKNKKLCPAFTNQTAGGNSTKLHRSDQYKPFLPISLACSASLHKIAPRAKIVKKESPCSTSTLLVEF
jgi:hypothetical protein